MQQQFLRGNALDVLETLPNESIDTVVTSPPYWALRKYPPDTIFVWDGKKDCEHMWGEEQNFRNQPGTLLGKSSKIGASLKGIQKPTGNFWICSKCNAWKGQLGLEPSFQMYISHLLQIFAQVKRVLKSNGSFYLNIADTYAGGHGNSGNYIRGPNSCFPGETSKLFPDVSVNANVSDIPVKSLIGVPWRLAIRMIDEQQWILRNCIIWCLVGTVPIYARSNDRPIRTTIRELYRLKNNKLELPGVDGWRNIVKIERFPKAECLMLHLRNGFKIKCTHEHKFPLNGVNVNASDLKVGDILESSKISNHSFGIMNYEIGWLIGLFLADGSFETKNHTALRFSLCSDELAFANRLANIAKKLSAYYRHHIYGKNLAVILDGHAIVGLVKQYVTGENAYKKHLSHRAWNENTDFLCGVIDGWLDGDGYFEKVSNRYRIVFTVNDELLEDMRVIAAMFGWSFRSRRGHSTYQYGKKKSIFVCIRKKITPHWNSKDDHEIVKITKMKAIIYGIEVDKDNIFVLPDGTKTHNSKPNHMPGSQKDRLTNCYEFIFHFVKSKRYYYELNRIRIPHTASGLARYKYSFADWKGASGNSSWVQTKDNKKRKMLPIGETRGDVHEGEASANLYRGHNEYHEHGKNPSDIMQLQMKDEMKRESVERGFTEHSNRLTTGLHASGRHGIDVRHSLGKTPADFLQLSTEPYAKAHFAKFPTSLPIFCIVPSTPPNGVILDPFAGVASTALACEYLNRGIYNKIRYHLNDFAKKVGWQLSWIMIEPSEEYVRLAKERLGCFLVNKFKEQTSFDS